MHENEERRRLTDEADRLDNLAEELAEECHSASEYYYHRANHLRNLAQDGEEQ